MIGEWVSKQRGPGRTAGSQTQGPERPFPVAHGGPGTASHYKTLDGVNTVEVTSPSELPRTRAVPLVGCVPKG